MHPATRAPRLVLAGLLAAAGFLVLGPLPVDLFTETVRATRNVADALGFDGSSIHKLDVEKACNVLIAVPIGFLLARGWPAVDPRRWLAAALAVSIAVELAQTFVLSGRYGTVLDVVLNTTGAAVGLLLASGVRRPQRSSAVKAKSSS
ncbi:VanZ family protein [Patulibacter minatonensis]|uniref:VanZ family protein n=1 Tax=Patulibacter minatonensis TaxID=298163 RepID=UPI0004B40B74|nr:VanZ family protein [Patulibacter minatonensis]